MMSSINRICFFLNSFRTPSSAALGLVLFLIGAFYISLVLWPIFINSLKTWNTLGINPLICLLHSAVSTLIVIGAIHLIPTASSQDFVDINLPRIIGVFLIFLNLITLFGYSLIVLLKLLGFFWSRKEKMNCEKATALKK